MKYAHELKKRLCKEIDDIYEKGGQLKMSDVELLQKMTDTVKNIDKIEMLEGEGDDMSMRGSYRGGSYDSMARGGRGRSRDSYDGSYDDGDSYARRGEHYVRAHYSRDDGSMRSNARDRRYSRADAKDHLLNTIGEMMEHASPEEKKILKHTMHEIQDID